MLYVTDLASVMQDWGLDADVVDLYKPKLRKQMKWFGLYFRILEWFNSIVEFIEAI